MTTRRARRERERAAERARALAAGEPVEESSPAPDPTPPPAPAPASPLAAGQEPPTAETPVRVADSPRSWLPPVPDVPATDGYARAVPAASAPDVSPPAGPPHVAPLSSAPGRTVPPQPAPVPDSASSSAPRRVRRRDRSDLRRPPVDDQPDVAPDVAPASGDMASGDMASGDVPTGDPASKGPTTGDPASGDVRTGPASGDVRTGPVSDVGVTSTGVLRAADGTRVRRLDRSVMQSHHVLVLPRPVSAAELAAVLVERAPEVRTRRDDEIQLGAGALLTGPWFVDEALAADFDLPGTTAFVLRVRADRGEPAPPELHGLDPLDDAFPDGSPRGDELQALEDVQALARRLRGAVRVTGTGAVVVPDPDARVDRLVRSEVRLGATELAVLLDRWLDDVVILADDVWGGGSAAVGGRLPGEGPEWARDMISIEATTAPPAVDHRGLGVAPTVHGAPGPGAPTAGPAPASGAGSPTTAAGEPARRTPLAERFEVPPLVAPHLGRGASGDVHEDPHPTVVPGSRPVLTYEVRFRPGRPDDILGTNPSRAARRSRRAAQRVVDGVAADLVGLIGGQVVDDDGFHRTVGPPT